MKKISTLVAALLLLFSNALSAQECVIKMKTAHAIGEYMGFSIQSNGNEVDIIGAEYQKDDGSFKVTAQEVELRGKITRLDCSSNWLESIDVSGNNLLTELYCDNNRLTDITLGQQPNLKELYVGDNQLASIDLSGVPNLNMLSIYKNPLTSLDLSTNTKITELICRECQLEGTLDLSANPMLQKLGCYNNNISAIKIAPNSSLGKLEIERNNINGENRTNLVNALPKFQVLPDYDDWYGMDPQCIVVLEYDSDLENNSLTASDLAVLKSKGWPVKAVDNVDNFGDIKDVDGTMTSIDKVNGAQAATEPTAVYDITGRAVSASSARGGIYIRKNGNKVSKVLLR